MKANHLIILRVVVLYALFLAGCNPEQKNNQHSFTWEQSNPLTEGINQTTIDSIHREIQQGAYGLMDHWLLQLLSSR